MGWGLSGLVLTCNVEPEVWAWMLDRWMMIQQRCDAAWYSTMRDTMAVCEMER